MVAYLVNQIILGQLTYNDVVNKRPDMKAKIDKYIIDNNISIV